MNNVTWQQFDENSREELKQLQVELKEHTYSPLPVRNVTLYKGEKARVIALYSMRDKVVQQSLASELAKQFEGWLSTQSYAYRSDRSALQAIGEINAAIGTHQYGAVLKVDITHFFDNIDWKILHSHLSRTIQEEDVLDLIHMNACTASLDDVSGELCEKTIGIHQGSAIAPVLSNIYMMDFDIALARPEHFYVRYSDDMLVLGSDRQKLLSLINEIKLRLEELRLEANESKTICCSLSDGVDFLGYHLNSSGKSIPAKAEDKLHDRLETMWLTNPTLTVEEKASKALEIVGGWQQYYRDERKINSIYEYTAMLYALGGRKEMLDLLRNRRSDLTNACRDIAEYLASFWKKRAEWKLELLEYEQFFELPDHSVGRQSVTEDTSKRLLSLYRKHFIYETSDTAIEIMQSYTDMQEYANAQHWMDLSEKLQLRKKRFYSISERLKRSVKAEPVTTPASADRAIPVTNVVDSVSVESADASVHEVPTAVITVNTSLSPKTAPTVGSSTKPKSSINPVENSVVPLITDHTTLKILESFAGRDDIFSTEYSVGNQHRKTELQERPLTEQQVDEHLRGEITIGTYIQRPNSTVRFIVWDIDISKHFLLKYGSCGIEFDACLQHAYHKALEIQNLLEDKGMRGYIEFSGFRGYHVWLFLTEWIPVRFANMFTDRMAEEIIQEDDITIECFPNKVRLKQGRFGQILKLPYGIHVRSGRRSCFIDDDGEPVSDIDGFTDALARYPLSSIRRVLSTGAPASGQDGRDTPVFSQVKSLSLEDLQEAFGETDASIQEILFHCSLMQYLCMKAKRTGYLTHFERLSILYVFGHVGEEGKEFVHEVMRCTLNYQYNVTQRFIDRLPEKPVSCVKLREQYKKVTAEIGCTCSFKRTKNCYPSPVLHALSLSGDVQEKITIPTSRTLTAEKEKMVIEEINVHKKAQALAVRILDLRKQQRALEKSIRKVEGELEKVYDSIEVNALEIEMGLLVRRKKDHGYEWIIEI